MNNKKQKKKNQSDSAFPLQTAFRGDPFFEEVFAKLNLSPSEIQKAAYRLGVPSDILFAYANGLRVPHSLTEVINIARELGDAEGLLHDAWAKEKTAQMELTQPLPKEMGEKTKEWIRYLRYALWHRHEGVTGRVAGMESATVQNLIQDGDFLDWKVEIWEKNATRILNGFEIRGRQKEILEKLNGFLEEKKYPFFEEWMISASKEDILTFRLKQLAQKLGRSPTKDEVKAERGMASSTTYVNKFDKSFNKALEAAGLKPTLILTNKTREELIADLQSLATTLGRSPTRDEVNAEKGMASIATYARKFGSLNKALEAAGLATRKMGQRVK